MRIMMFQLSGFYLTNNSCSHELTLLAHHLTNQSPRHSTMAMTAVLPINPKAFLASPDAGVSDTMQRLISRPRKWSRQVMRRNRGQDVEHMKP